MWRMSPASWCGSAPTAETGIRTCCPWPAEPAATSGPSSGTRGRTQEIKDRVLHSVGTGQNGETMNYGNIKKYDIADGPGVRVSLFVSGCRHHCRGCFNPETWNFSYGKLFTEETAQEIPGSPEAGLHPGVLPFLEENLLNRKISRNWQRCWKRSGRRTPKRISGVIPATCMRKT